MSTRKELWAEYRRTWRDFSGKLGEMQQLADAGASGEVVAQKLEGLKRARMAHNAARDRLAEVLAPRKSDRDALSTREQSIRRTAKLIWEFSGKPENSAESDWLRAERLVQAASA